MVESQMAHQDRYEHGMLDDVTHDAGTVETFCRNGDSYVAFHFSLCAHFLQFVFFRFQFALVFERRFRHVGQEMAEFDVVPPSLLVTGGIIESQL